MISRKTGRILSEAQIKASERRKWARNIGRSDHPVSWKAFERLVELSPDQNINNLDYWYFMSFAEGELRCNHPECSGAPACATNPLERDYQAYVSKLEDSMSRDEYLNRRLAEAL